METKVVITADVIDSNMEGTLSAGPVALNGKPLSRSIPAFLGMGSKIYHILKDPRSVEMKQTVSASKETITWLSILSNSSTSELFGMFKSMGIYMPRLVIGVCEETNTVYTSSKLLKDLRRYSETQRAAVIMYMLSLVKFVKTAEEMCLQYMFDGLSGMLQLKISEDNFDKCIRNFTPEETWYMKDTNKDDYTKVQFFNTAYTSTNDTFSNTSAIRIGIIKHNSGQLAGVATVAFGKTKFSFVLSQKAAYTDFDLCNIEISMDSICACIANAYEHSFTLTKVDKLPLNKESTFLECEGDFDDFVASEKVPKWLASWVVKMLAKGAVLADLAEFDHLVKTYNVGLPASYSATAGATADEMREMYKDDAFAQELYKQIKPYYDTYKLGEALDANLKGFSNGALYSMAFVGESGTGKSTAARVIPARCGIPYISVNFSVNIEEADLFGTMTPNPCKVKAEDPEFVWVDGIITKAIRNGYCVILEELNFARPGVLGKLNSLLDENRQIDLSTGEIVRAHPNFRIIATCNISYEGTNRFNKALINRFDDVTVFKDLARFEAIEVIKQRTGYTNATKISKVYDVYEALKKFATEQNVNLVVSMRQLLNIFTKGKYYSSAKDAIQRIMINGAFIEDQEYQEVFEETVFTAFDLKFKI